MRVLVALVVAAVCLQVAQGAVTLRFINTVPNEEAVSRSATNNPARAGYNAAAALLSETREQAFIANRVSDRVGLYYFPSGNTLDAETTVWTEANRGYGNGNVGTGFGSGVFDTTNLATSTITGNNFLYQMAMPPLRAYHTTAANAETNAVDRVANYRKCIYKCALAADNTADGTVDTNNNAGGANNFVSTDNDQMDHLGLKADGVGQYLTFAAGTYKMQAYGIKGLTAESPANGATALQTATTAKFATSVSTLQFKDWHVYTLIASGDAKWSANMVGSDVKLTLIEESVASTVFGKASLRFFHAIQSESARAIDVYSGTDVSSATKVINGLAWNTASAYLDVTPNTASIFPLAYDVSDATTTIQTGTTVTMDVRAGLRATVICGINDIVNREAFCRMIPSRVVAYVRMVNDVASLTSHVQGRFGPQQINETPLSVWGSWDYPRPATQDSSSQDIDAKVASGLGATTNGLYPVLPSVSAGTVSGYGEVHVPLFIMDTAVTRGVFVAGNTLNEVTTNDATQNFRRRSDNFIGGAAVATVNTELGQGYPDGQGYDYSARYKRVNLVVKTDGFSTVGDRLDSSAQLSQLRSADLSLSTVDIPTEPGQYYTLFITPAMKKLAAGNSAESTLTTVEDGFSNVQNGGVIEYGYALDRSIDSVSLGNTAGKARVRFVSFGLASQSYHKNTRNGVSTGGTNGLANNEIQSNQVLVLRQFGSKGVSLDGNTAATGSTTSSMTITPKAVGVAETTGHSIVSNYVRLDSEVNYGNQLQSPASDSIVTLAAGDYTFTYKVGAADTDKCDFGIPPKDLSLADGDFATVYVLNWWGCKKATTPNPSVLETHIVKETAYNAESAPVAQTFFGAASSVSASITLLVAAALALLAIF